MENAYIAQQPQGTPAQILDQILSDNYWLRVIRSYRAIFPEEGKPLPEPVALTGKRDAIASFGPGMCWYPIVHRDYRAYNMNLLDDAALMELLSIPEALPKDCNAILLIDIDDGNPEALLDHIAERYPGPVGCNWGSAQHGIASQFGRVASGAFILNKEGTKVFGRDRFPEEEIAAAYLLHLAADDSKIQPERFLGTQYDDESAARYAAYAVNHISGQAESSRRLSYGKIDFPMEDITRMLSEGDWNRISSLVRVLPDVSANKWAGTFSELYAGRNRYIGGWQDIYKYFGCRRPVGSTSPLLAMPDVLHASVKSLGLDALFEDPRYHPPFGDADESLGYAAAKLADINFEGTEKLPTLPEDVDCYLVREGTGFNYPKLPMPRNTFLNYMVGPNALIMDSCSFGIYDVGGYSPDDPAFPRIMDTMSRTEEPEWTIVCVDGFVGESSGEAGREVVRSLLSCLLFLGIIPSDAWRIAPLETSGLPDSVLEEYGDLIGKGKARVVYDPDGVFGEEKFADLAGLLENDGKHVRLTDAAVSMFGRAELLPLDEVASSVISQRFYEIIDDRGREAALALLDRDFTVSPEFFEAISLGRSRFSGASFPVDGNIKLSRTFGNGFFPFDGLCAEKHRAWHAFAEELFDLMRLWVELMGWIPELGAEAGGGLIREMARQLDADLYIGAVCKGIEVEDLL